jgi:ABC-type glycerol-3-phosphate transport system substrate-binding protein
LIREDYLMKSKKLIAILVIAAFLVSMLAACGSSESKSVSNEAKEVTISVFGVPNDWRDAGNLLEETFMKKYPNIKIEDIAYVADSITFIKTRAAAGDLPDITEINNDETGLRLAKDGKMMDLKGLEDTKHISAKLLQAYTLEDGKVFGLPQGSSTSFIYYNKDIFKSVGIQKVPTDLEEFLADCKIIQDSGTTPIALPGMDPWSIGFTYDWMWANMLGANSGSGYEKSFKDGTFSLDNAEGIEVMKNVQSVSKFFQKGVTSASETAAFDLFAQKKVAMAFGGSWTAALADKTGFAGAFFPPFNKKGTTDNWIINCPESAIGASTTHDTPECNDAKIKFLEFWFSPEGYQIEQNARGNIPSIDNAKDVKILSDIKELLPVINKSSAIPFAGNSMSSQAFDIFISGCQELFIDAVTPEALAKKVSDAAAKYPKKG